VSLEPQPEPLDADQQTHFLLRTQWAVTAADRRDLSEAGLEAFLDRILDPPAEPDVEAEAAQHITYPMHPSGQDLALWWLKLMTRTRHPFRDAMAFFWHDHFATSQVKFAQATTMYMLREHVQTLRSLALGNLRLLLHAMVSDPAMQVWLDGVTSTREQPNENLAREFFERFALGLDRGYTQEDIVATARAFTGYRLLPSRSVPVRTVVFDPALHDPGPKTIFGRTDAFGLDAVVDLTIAERDVAGFIARRLFEHFCYRDAPDAVVAELAAVLRDHRYELRPTLATLLRSRAFFSAASRRSQVKSPVEAAVGLLRATELPIPVSVLDYVLTAQGQRPTEPPDVGGWPADTAWLEPSGLILRSGLAHALAVDRVYQAERGADIARLLPGGAATTAAEAVAALAERLSVVVAPEETAIYVDYLDTRATLAGGALQTTREPFDAGNPQHIAERLRGLLFLLTQHPTFLLR